MNSPFLGEVLILVLLIINCSRMFFLRYGKVDTLTVLSPVCIILSILQIVSWNADIFSVALLAVSLFAFFINFRALLRFVSGLYVDHYSAAFKIGAFLVLAFSAAELCLLVYFRPVIIRPADYKVSETRMRVSGSFNSGFHKSSPFELSDGIVTLYQPERAESRGQIIVIIPDKRADSLMYAPYACRLAGMGYKVYSADFYSHDMRWFHNAADIRYFRKLYMIYSYFKSPVRFEAEKEFYSFNTMRETEAMLKFVVHNEGGLENAGKPFFIGDWMSSISLEDFAKIHGDEIGGFICLSEMDDYRTPGFGFVEQLEPFVAYRLGLKRNSALNMVEKLASDTKALVPVPEQSDGGTKENEDDTERT